MVSYASDGQIDKDKEYKRDAALVLTWLSGSATIATEGNGQHAIGTELQYRVERFFRHAVGNRTETIPDLLFAFERRASVVQRILQQVLSEDSDFKDKDLRITTEVREALAEPGVIKAKFRLHTQDQPEELQAALQKKLSVLKTKINSLPLMLATATESKRR